MYRYLRNFFFLHYILFYFIFPLYDIWFIDNNLLHSYLYLLLLLSFNYEEERDVDLCFGEKYIYKSWITYICMVINKVYIVTTWSNSCHTINLKKQNLLHCIFLHILLYIIPDYKIYFVTLKKTSNLKHNFK